MTALAYAWCVVGFLFGVALSFAFVIYREDQRFQNEREA